MNRHILALERLPLRPGPGWAVAAASLVVAVVVRHEVDTLLPPAGFPFLTFFPAVVLSALLGGVWPGLAVSALSTLAAWYWFLGVEDGFRIHGFTDLVALGFFLFVALVDCAVIGALHNALARVRAAREQSQALATTLEARVAERTGALAAEVRERQRVEVALTEARRLESLGQLTGGLAHDFNNLLQVVIGQSDRIVAISTEDPVRRMAGTVRHAALRGAALTAQLLAFSRRQILQPRALDLGALLPPLRELIARGVGEAVVVVAEAPAALWPVRADPAQFESAMLNLAINARDAMPRGGRLLLRAANAAQGPAQAARLEVPPGDYVSVRVSDDGEGMTPEVLARAFEPFFTTKEFGRGTGLGLAQIYGFARQSGGAVAIESAPGRGTAVTLYLPRADAGDLPTPAFAVPAAPVGARRRLLVVEDSPEVRAVVEEQLLEAGYWVHAAASGEAALALLAAELPDLLLTDLVMPGAVDGLELVRRARALAPDLRVLVMSGHAPDSEAVGRLPLLSKPFRMAELLAAVARALG